LPSFVVSCPLALPLALLCGAGLDRTVGAEATSAVVPVLSAGEVIRPVALRLGVEEEVAFATGALLSTTPGRAKATAPRRARAAAVPRSQAGRR